MDLLQNRPSFGSRISSTHALEILPEDAFFIGLGRAMVSLGPISSSRYCPYQCRFCYVQGPFPKYAPATPSEILEWLTPRRTNFDIVYVSGDTDTFAKPRTELGVELLERLLELDCDVLFTTRYVFSETERERLIDIGKGYRRRGRLLFGCISVSQLHHPELEPRPIASPESRIELLSELRESGIVSVLTIRPFIPAVSPAEYALIAQQGMHAADVILGGDLYLDPQGEIEAAINKALIPSYTPRHQRISGLDFSLGADKWTILRHDEAESAVRNVCAAASKPFFMRSAGAVALIRENRSHYLAR
jgi:hypothetical protein